MSGAIPPLSQYAFVAWCLVQHRDSFTFAFYWCSMQLEMPRWLNVENKVTCVLHAQRNTASSFIIESVKLQCCRSLPFSWKNIFWIQFNLLVLSVQLSDKWDVLYRTGTLVAVATFVRMSALADSGLPLLCVEYWSLLSNLSHDWP
jgi:hypothetical protein